MLSLVRERICPTIIKYFSEKAEFALTVRLMRVCKVLVKHFHKPLAMQCEVFLSLFSKILESGTFPNWQRVLVLECYKSFSNDGALQRNLFDVYDTNPHSANIYTEIVHGICSVVFGAHNYLLYFTETPNEPFALNSQSAGMRIPCLEHLEKNEPPVFPDVYPILLAFQSITHLVDTQAEFILPILLKREDGSEQNFEKEIFLAIEMAKTGGPVYWYALTILSVSSVDDEIFQRVLKTVEKYCTIVGLLGLVSYRDSILGTLCKISITSLLPAEVDVNDLPTEIPPFQFTNLHNKNQIYTLSDRNIQFLVCLIQATELLTDVMDAKTWYAVLETLQLADFLIFSRSFKRLESMSTVLDMDKAPKESRIRSNTTSVATHSTFLESYITKTSLHPSTENLASLFSSVAKKMYEGTKQMKTRAYMEFTRALCRLAQETTAGNSSPSTGNYGKEMKSSDEKSYAVSKLLEVVQLNIPRFVSPDDFGVFDLVATQLTNIAQSPTCSVGIRTQVCNSFGDILVSISQDPAFRLEPVELHILESIKVLMALDFKTPTDQTPEQESVLRSFLPEVRRLGMDVVNRLLQTSGQCVTHGWCTIFEIILQTLQSLSSMRKAKWIEQSRMFESSAAIPAAMSPSIAVSESPLGMDPGVIAPKTNSAFKVGFACVQLICTDFLSNLNPMALSKCIETVAAFGSALEDLNISLTAVGLLWSLCDFILTSKQKWVKESAESPVPAVSTSNDALNLDILQETMSARTMDTLWMFLLRKLSDLCSDERPEIRNSANQTLFRTIGMNGERLTLASWNMCINHVLFPLLEKIQDSSTPTHQQPGMEKQWNESKILALSGVTKCLTDFLPVLVDLERFPSQWTVFLNFIKTTCLQSTQEVALAGLKNFRALMQYVKPNTDQVLASNLVPHVETLWYKAFEVWVQLGQGILDTADENNWDEKEKQFCPIVEWSNDRTPTLLQGPFTQDCLALYCSIVFDVYPVILDRFGSKEFDEVMSMWQCLLLYHSKPPPGSTQSRLRAEIVQDMDTMTPTQSHFIDFLTGKVNLGRIPGVEEWVYVILADTTLTPFIPFAVCSSKPEDAKAPLYASPHVRKHTFVALARRAFHLIQQQFESTNRETLLLSGALEHVLESLQVHLSYKYDGPPSISKDPTPLWKLAAGITKTLIQQSIPVLREIEGRSR
jgi:hypothetical protein